MKTKKFGLELSGFGYACYNADGEYWKESTHNEKCNIARGIYDGFLVGITVAGSPIFFDRAFNLYYHDADLLLDLVPAIDRFYMDRENSNIPISYALLMITLDYKGESVKEIDKKLQSLRKGFSDKYWNLRLTDETS